LMTFYGRLWLKLIHWPNENLCVIGHLGLVIDLETFFFSLAPQPSLGLGLLRNLLPLKMAEFLGGFSTIFYRLALLAPRPTPPLEDQASVFISPRGRLAHVYPPPQAPGTHVSRLLRHAWVTVGLFLFPGQHTGNHW
jgi:hypothetical protein